MTSGVLWAPLGNPCNGEWQGTVCTVGINELFVSVAVTSDDGHPNRMGFILAHILLEVPAHCCLPLWELQ